MYRYRAAPSRRRCPRLGADPADLVISLVVDGAVQARPDETILLLRGTLHHHAWVHVTPGQAATTLPCTHEHIPVIVVVIALTFAAATVGVTCTRVNHR